MKNLKLFTLFALITAALLFMFSCNKVEITNNPDDIYDEEKTDSSGLLVKEKTYPYGENDVLLLSVNNPTDKNLSITINVSYFDNENNLLKEDVRTYDQMYSGGGNNFIFNPQISFDSYSYSVLTKEYNGTVISSDINLKFNGINRIIATSIGEGQYAAVVSNATLSYTGKLSSVYIGVHFLLIDKYGELYGIYHLGNIAVYPNSPNSRTAFILKSKNEDISIPDELNGDISIVYDFTTIKECNDTKKHITYEGLPDGFIVEEKEYKVGDEIYSLIYIKNETEKDYQLNYKTFTYEDGVSLGGGKDIFNFGNYSAGYENYFWLIKEAVSKSKESIYEYEYEFFVDDAKGEIINLHYEFNNISKIDVIYPTDGKSHPAIAGELSPKCDITPNNISVSVQIIGLDKNDRVCCIGGFGESLNNEHSKSIVLTYVDTEDTNLINTTTEDMNYIVAIDRALSLG